MSDKDIKATKTSNNIVRSFIKVKQEDGSSAVMSIELDRALNFMNAQKES